MGQDPRSEGGPFRPVGFQLRTLCSGLASNKEETKEERFGVAHQSNSISTNPFSLPHRWSTRDDLDGRPTRCFQPDQGYTN